MIGPGHLNCVDHECSHISNENNDTHMHKNTTKKSQDKHLRSMCMIVISKVPRVQWMTWSEYLSSQIHMLKILNVMVFGR